MYSSFTFHAQDQKEKNASQKKKSESAHMTHNPFQAGWCSSIPDRRHDFPKITIGTTNKSQLVLSQNY